MKEFGECSDRTQKEILELITTDKYKAKKDLSHFNNLKDSTQKEIAELFLAKDYDSEKAEEQMNELLFENKFDVSETQGVSEHSQKQVFDGFRIFKITQFEAEQARLQKQRMKDLEKQETRENKREFTDPELIKHSLGLKKAEGGLVSITIKEKNHPELKTGKDLLKTIRDNEQKYTRLETEQQIKLLKDITTLGYDIKLY